jgi:hypothetical protein
MPGNAPRHSWQSRQSRLHRSPNLLMARGSQEFESHSLRHCKINNLAGSSAAVGQYRAMGRGTPLPMRGRRMALHLYRRHRRDCRGNHPEASRSGEFHERRKTWKRCECVIYVSGTLAGRFNRRPTAKTTWEDARAYLTALETGQTWDGPGEAVPGSDGPASEPTAANGAEAAPSGSPARRPGPSIQGIVSTL